MCTWITENRRATTFSLGDYIKLANIHWQLLKIFFTRTTEPISTLPIVMRLYLFVWPKYLLIVNYIIKSLYSMVKINLEYFHCITYDSIFVVWWLFKNLMEWPRDCCVYIREYSSNRNRTSRCFLLLAFSSIS